jgi:hypothetical protein
MLGFYDDFPANIHRLENFTSALSTRKLQQRLIQVLHGINMKTFSFDQITCPTVPDCTVILEAGLAEGKSFNYIDEEEKKKALSALRKAPFQTLDLFCAVRYYKGKAEKKKPLRFDYYMLRIVFVRNALEVQVFHERGPRYLSPEDFIAFLASEVNKTAARKILKATEPSQ